MLSFSYHARIKQSVIFVVIVSLLIIALSSQAQEGSDVAPLATSEVTAAEELTPEATPTEEITPEVTPTEEITPEVTHTEETTPEVTPTEELTPEPTSEATVEPTLEPTLQPTSEVTPEPTSAPTLEPTLEPTPEPLPLAFHDDFEDGLDPAWEVRPEWFPVAVEGGQGIQPGADGGSLRYQASFFKDLIITTRVMYHSGGFGFFARADYDLYMIDVSDGDLTISRSGIPLGNTAVSLPIDEWFTFRVSIIGNELVASINGTPVLAVTDPVVDGPVDAGYILFSAYGLTRFDDFKIYGVPLPYAPLTVPTSFRYEVTPPSTTVFTWNDGRNETEYQLSYYDNTLGDYVVFATIPANTTTYTYTAPTCGHTVDYWIQGYNNLTDSYTQRVQVIPHRNDFIRCVAPTLISPTDGATISNSTPELTWNSIGGTRFELQISTVPTFDDVPPGYPLYDVTDIAGTSHMPTALADGTYYWRVMTSGPDQSEFSEVHSFTIDTDEPSEPLPLAFYDDFEDGLDPAWTVSGTWAPVAGESGQATQGQETPSMPGLNPELSYRAAFFDDTIVTFKVLFEPGQSSGIAVGLRDGRGINLFTLDDTGSVYIGIGLGNTDVTLPVGEWLDIRLSAIGDQLTYSINGVTVLTVTDPIPQGPGLVYIEAFGDPVQVSIDEFKIYGEPLPPVILTDPQNFRYTVDAPSSLIFEWDDADNETEYQITYYDNSTHQYVPIATVPENTTTYTYTVPTCGARSSYTLFAYRSITNEYSTPIQAYRTDESDLPCAPATLVSPANGAVITDNTPTLMWTAEPTATVFEVQISKSPSFYPQLAGYTRYDITTTSYTLTPPLPDGTYYWRVLSNGFGSSDFSDEWSFTIDSVVVPSPIPTSPANLSLVRTHPVIFKWSAVPGAASYDVVFNGETIATTNLTAVSSTFDIPQGDSSWYVIAHTAAGDSSAPSVTMNLTFNRALSPDPNDVIVPPGAVDSANVVFTWSAAPGSPTYNVQIDEASEGDFATPLALTCSTSALTCTIPGVPEGAYVWRVLRLGETPRSVVSNAFFVSPAAPRAPRLVSPSNAGFLPPADRMGGIVNLSWDWGAPPSPAGGPFTYEVEVSTSLLFNNTPVFTQTTAANTQTATTPALADGRYYWRVRAVNSFGVAGSWSTGFSFTVDSTPPAAPVVLTPNGTTILQTARPTFTWTPVTGATHYALEVNDVCGDGSPFYATSGTIIATAHTIPVTADALPQGAQNACVKAFDASENDSGFGPAKTFTIFLGTSPAQGAFILTTTNPVFIWNPTPGTTNLTLEYDTDTDFTSGATQISVTGTVKALPAPLPAGTYYWRVVRNGETFASNVYRTFFVGSMSVGPELTEPVLNALTNANPVHLSWNAATPPTGLTITDYEVVLSKSPLFTTLIGTPQFIPAGDALQYDFVPSDNENRVRHYWRVRGLSNGVPVTQWSSSSFILDNVAPATPVIAGPTPNSLIQSVRPLFFWTAVPTATQYIVEATDGDGNQIFTGTTTITSYIPTVNLPQTNVFFRVVASDGINTSASAASVEFRVRLGTTPAMGGNIITNRPTFTWAAVPDATAYTLDIDDDPMFEADDPLIIPSIPLGTVTSYTLSAAQALPTSGIYYWRLSHNGLNGAFPIEFGSRFFTFNAPLAKPTNLTVQNQFGVADTVINASEDNPVTLLWIAPAGAAPQAYEFQIAATNTFTAPEITVYTLPTFHTLGEGAIPNGVKYWRVRARYSSDGLSNGPWSDTATFTIDAIPPASPSTVISDETTFETARPTFSWLAVTGAVGYRLSVTNVDAGTTLLDNMPIVGTSYTIPNTMPALIQGQQHIWQVEAVDAAGNVSSGFVPRSFRIFLGLSPANNDFITDSTPTFSWTTVPATTSSVWRLEVDDSPDMTSLTMSETVPISSTSYTLTTSLTPGKQYWWRVAREGEEAGNIVPRSFWVVGDTADVIPDLLTPSSGQLLNSNQVNSGIVFTWTEPSVTAANVQYNLQIANNALFVLPVEVTLIGPDSPTYIWTALPLDGTYWWRVRTILNEDPAPWSAVRTFTVDQTAPGTPILNTPVDSAVITTTRMPTFSWGAVTGTPTQYVFELANDEAFTSLRYTATINVPGMAFSLPASQGLPDGEYYWRIKSRDAAGNNSVPSEVRSFTIAVP